MLSEFCFQRGAVIPAAQMEETLRSPSQVEADIGGDPYKISHITDWLELKPIESTYRTKNGYVV